MYNEFLLYEVRDYFLAKDASSATSDKGNALTIFVILRPSDLTKAIFTRADVWNHTEVLT